MEKGEIAHYEQFLLFLQSFQKTLLQTRKNEGLFGKGLTLYLSKNPRENIDGKGENAGYHHFLTTLVKNPYENIDFKGEKEKIMVTSIFFLSHNIFKPIKVKIHQLKALFILSPANAFNLDKFKILSFGKELKRPKIFSPTTIWLYKVHQAIGITLHGVQKWNQRGINLQVLELQPRVRSHYV